MALMCEICNVPIQSEVVMRVHVKGKKHLHLAAVYEKRRYLAERSIYIRGHLARTSSAAVKKHFSQYGSVESVFLEKEKSYGFVEFKEAGAVSLAIKKPNTVSGVSLTVRPREVKNITRARKDGKVEKSPAQEKTADPAITYENLVSKLCQTTCISEQMALVKEELELNADDVKERKNLVHLLQQHFRTIFPNAHLHQFGSSVNGLGVKGCDMDLFLDLGLQDPDIMADPVYHKEIRFPVYVKGLTSIRGTDGKVSLSSFGKAPIQDQVKVIGRLLCNPAIGCREVFSITSARCPVVKFAHETTGIKCDLSMNNRLALRNTHLIQLVMSRDKRIQELMYTIRYWAKLKELAGNVNAGPLLTNYALTMVVFFFLQNLKDPLIPTIDELAAVADPESPEETINIEGWDCTFTWDMNKLPVISNTMLVEELFYKFLEFYASFDFVNSVICPRSGRSVELAEFKTSPASYLAQFRVASMNVQDPFVLEHNTALNINEKTKDRFLLECRQALAKLKQPQFQKPVSGDPCCHDWGITYIFSKATILPSLNSQIDQSQTPKNFKVHSGHHFLVMFQPAKLDYSTYLHCRSTLEVKVEWVLRTLELLLRTLQKLMLCKCFEEHDGRDNWKDSWIRRSKSGSYQDQCDASLTVENKSCDSAGPQQVGFGLACKEELQDGSVKLADLDPQISEISEIKLTECCSKVALKRMSPDSPVRWSKKLKSDPIVLSKMKSAEKEEAETTLQMLTDSSMANKGTSAADMNVSDKKSVSSEIMNPFMRSIVSAGIGVNEVQQERSLTLSPDCPLGGTLKRDSSELKLKSCSSRQTSGLSPEKLEALPVIKLQCTAYQKMWISRKSIRKELRQEIPDTIDKLTEWEIEEQVTKILMGQLPKSGSEPCIGFTLLGFAECLKSDTAVVLEFHPYIEEKEFYNFFPFFKTYFHKLVDKCLFQY